MNHTQPARSSTDKAGTSIQPVHDHLVMLVVFVSIFVASCSKKSSSLPEPPLRPVITQIVADVVGTETRTFTGVIEASGLATLGFEVPGRIIEMIAVEGRTYRQGDVLAILDVANLEADLSRAEAEALKANEELKRTDQLFASSNASRAQFDSAIAAQLGADASLRIARKKVADGTLTMPYDGVIEDVLLDEQSVVAQGAQVLTIQGKGAMRLDIGVPAEVISEVKVGKLATVKVTSISEKPIQAKVRKVSPQALKNGTYVVNLDLVSAPTEIRGGMDAEAQMDFVNPRGKAVHVESAAIVGSADSNSYVWVVTNTSQNVGVVKKHPVTIGAQSGEGEMEVSDGLAPGDEVVTRGAHRFTDGQRVKLIEPAPEP